MHFFAPLWNPKTKREWEKEHWPKKNPTQEENKKRDLEIRRDGLLPERVPEARVRGRRRERERREDVRRGEGVRRGHESRGPPRVRRAERRASGGCTVRSGILWRAMGHTQCPHPPATQAASALDDCAELLNVMFCPLWLGRNYAPERFVQ